MTLIQVFVFHLAFLIKRPYIHIPKAYSTCVGGIRRAKSSGTSQYIKCTVCHVLMRLYMDKTSREEQPQAFLAVPLCLRACVRECASCGQVRKQPGSRIMFVLTEGESTEPPLLPRCKQRQDSDGESEAS